MKVFMAILVIFLSQNLLFAEQIGSETGVAVKDTAFVYAGQSTLTSNQEARIRKPASINTMNKYYRFFDSKEDNYKNLYY
ncbi:MAG: hypothetical protein WCQ47_01415 [bacterium]